MLPVSCSEPVAAYFRAILAQMETPQCVISSFEVLRHNKYYAELQIAHNNINFCVVQVLTLCRLGVS